LFVIEDKIVHKIDDSDLDRGFVTVVPKNIYVTKTDSTGNISIQRGVTVASLLDTINVQSALLDGNTRIYNGGAVIDKPLYIRGISNDLSGTVAQPIVQADSTIIFDPLAVQSAVFDVSNGANSVSFENINTVTDFQKIFKGITVTNPLATNLTVKKVTFTARNYPPSSTQSPAVGNDERIALNVQGTASENHAILVDSCTFRTITPANASNPNNIQFSPDGYTHSLVTSFTKGTVRNSTFITHNGEDVVIRDAVEQFNFNDNTIRGAGLLVEHGNLNSVVSVQRNRFVPDLPVWEAFKVIRNNQLSAQVLFNNNTVTSTKAGVWVAGSGNVNISQNTFNAQVSPATGTFNHIILDTKWWKTSTYPSNIPVTEEISTRATIVGNTFNSLSSRQGTAVRIRNQFDNPTVMSPGIAPIQITGNTFTSNLDLFIALDTLTNQLTNINPTGAAVLADIDATNNNYPGTPDLFDREDKMVHKMDDPTILTGLITMIPNQVFVTPNQRDYTIQRGIDVGDANWTVNVKIGNYGSSSETIRFYKQQSFAPQNGTVINSNIVVHQSDPAHSITQMNSFDFNGQRFSVQLGDWNLNGANILFSSTSNLSETPGNTIKGTAGTIRTTRVIDRGFQGNVAGFGVIFKSTDLGTTTIVRGHNRQVGNNGTSRGIERWYEIIPNQMSYGVNSVVGFMYDDSEIPFGMETGLQMYWKFLPVTSNPWYQFPDVNIDTQNNLSAALLTDILGLRVTISNGVNVLGDSLRVPVSIDSDINDESLAMNSIYPNPTQGQLTIDFQAATREDLTIEVIDLHGRIASTMNYHSIPGQNRVGLEINHLANGIYSVRLTGKTKHITAKIVKY
ncbi:MAG: T9SS type A sorting domain-containing protein, partial [Bacteroidia bacterium]|nr:T9SS type A sorting domain-containing protein [Bacteroidia bacterium]